MTAFSFFALGMAVALWAFDYISPLQFDLVFCVACGAALFAFMIRFGTWPPLSYLLMAGLICTAALARLIVPGVVLSPYLAIALINAFVAYIFARGQMPGRDPLIIQITKAAGSGMESTEEFRLFAYRQCLLWTLFGTMTSIAGILAMLFPALRSHSILGISILIFLQITWFILSHGYANQRHMRPETWRQTLRIFLSPKVWAKLDF